MDEDDHEVAFREMWRTESDTNSTADTEVGPPRLETTALVRIPG